jgi:hypothetical protein
MAAACGGSVMDEDKLEQITEKLHQHITNELKDYDLEDYAGILEYLAEQLYTDAKAAMEDLDQRES